MSGNTTNSVMKNMSMSNLPTLSNMPSLEDLAKLDDRIVGLGIMIFLVLIVVIVIWYVVVQIQKQDKNCSRMKKDYVNSSSITNVDFSKDEYAHNLNEYFVLGASNCCASGANKNDYVDLCALESCIKSGARLLDFKIYNKDNKPVIATASKDSFYYKESYNYLSLDEVLNTVRNNAFTADLSPNPRDPLILYFRIFSKNKMIYDGLAEGITEKLADRLLNSMTYSNESSGNNITNQRLKDFINRVIIVVKKDNEDLFNNSKLKDVTNLTTGPSSPFVREYKYGDVNSMMDISDLISYNRLNMSLVLPDNKVYTSNYNVTNVMKAGCQGVMMNFQTYDNEMKFAYELFNRANSAFVPKPDALRAYRTTIGPFKGVSEGQSCTPKEREFKIGTKTMKVRI